MKMMLAAILLALLGVAAQAQTQHDPLTGREVDELRESAQKPKERIDYLIGFARERVLAIDRLRTAAQPGQSADGKMADLLSDLASLIDELGDNLDMYNSHSEDLRRPLRHVLEAESEFQQKLKALGDNATPQQKRRIAIALEDASDSLQDSAESARAMLAGQLEKKGVEKNSAAEKNDKADSQTPQPRHAPDAAEQLPPDQAGMGGARPTQVEH